jgi:hypothetical protein
MNAALDAARAHGNGSRASAGHRPGRHASGRRGRRHVACLYAVEAASPAPSRVCICRNTPEGQRPYDRLSPCKPCWMLCWLGVSREYAGRHIQLSRLCFRIAVYELLCPGLGRCACVRVHHAEFTHTYMCIRVYRRKHLQSAKSRSTPPTSARPQPRLLRPYPQRTRASSW